MNFIGPLSFLRLTGPYQFLTLYPKENLERITQSQSSCDKEESISPVGVDCIESLTRSKIKKTVSFDESLNRIQFYKEAPGDQKEKWISEKDFKAIKEEAKEEVIQCVKNLKCQGRFYNKEIVYSVLFQPKSTKLYPPLIELD